MLAEHLIRKLNQDYGRSIEGIDESAAAALMGYSWPGNVRELENVIGRAMIFMHYHELRITARHLPELIQSSEKERHTGNVLIEDSGNITLAEAVEEVEKT